MKNIVIAIDGFSSSGKSTMARGLAKRIGYIYVDSGAMYRAVTLFALRNNLIDISNNVDVEALLKYLPKISVSFSAPDANGRQHTLLNGEDVEDEIRGMEVSHSVSKVAEIPEVRHQLVKLQQRLGENKGIVMDGRDIGTTVFPDAELKVFVNATPEVRAMRRLKELQESDPDISYEHVLKNIQQRDHIDRTRAESPLRKAADAVELDNDMLSREEQMDILLKLAREKMEE